MGDNFSCRTKELSIVEFGSDPISRDTNTRESGRFSQQLNLPQKKNVVGLGQPANPITLSWMYFSSNLEFTYTP